MKLSGIFGAMMAAKCNLHHHARDGFNSLRKYRCIFNRLRSIVYSKCDLAVLTARSLSFVNNLHPIPDE